MMKVQTAAQRAAPPAAQVPSIDDTRSLRELLLHGQLQVIASRVVHAVGEFFQWMARTILESSSFLKDRMVDLFPERLAIRVDPRRAFVRLLLQTPVDQRERVFLHALSVLSVPIDQNLRETLREKIKGNPSKGNPSNKRGRLSRSVLPLIPPEMCSPEKIAIIQKLGEIPVDQKDSVIAYAKRFITQEMDAQARIAAIEEAAKVPGDERAFIVDHDHPTFIQGLSGGPRRAMIEQVRTIDLKDRNSVIEGANPLITQEMDVESRRALFTALAALVAQEKRPLRRSADPLMLEGMDVESRRAILRALAAIEGAEERVSTLEQARSLITQGMDAESRVEILKAVAAIKGADRRRLVVMQASSLVTQAMDGGSRKGILEAVAALFHAPGSTMDSATSTPRGESVLDQARQCITQGMSAPLRKQMIELVAALSEEGRGAAVEALQRLACCRGIDEGSSQRIVQALVRVPVESREEVIRKVDSLMGVGAPTDEKIAMMEALAAIGIGREDLGNVRREREEVTREAVSLVRERATPLEKLTMMKALLAFPPDERVFAAKLAKEVFSEKLGNERRIELLEIIKSTPREERAGVVSTTARLMPQQVKSSTEDFRASHKARVMRAFKDLPAEEREALRGLAEQQIDPEMEGGERAKIIEIIRGIPKDQRAGVVSATARLMPHLKGSIEGFRASHKARVMRAFKGLSAEEREAVRELAGQQIDPEMGGDERAEIIEIISGLPKAQRAGVVSITARLLPRDVKIPRGLGGSYRARVMRALKDLPAEEREEVRGLAGQLIDPEMEGDDRVWIIEIISGLPKAQRAGVVSATARLMPRLKGSIKACYKARVMGAFKDLPAEEREAVRELAGQLIDPEMEGDDRATITQVLSRIPKDRRAGVVSATALLMPRLKGSMKACYKARVMIAFKDLPAEESAEVRELAQQQIDPEMEGGDRATIIEALSGIPRDRRAGVVSATARLMPHRKGPIKGFRAIYRAKAMEALKGLPVEEREVVRELAEQQIDPEMEGAGRAEIIEIISGLPKDRRARVVGTTALFMSRQLEELMTPFERAACKAGIMKSLKDFPGDNVHWLVTVVPWFAPTRMEYAEWLKILAGVAVEERNAFLWEAFKWIDKEMPTSTRLDLLKRLANTPASGRAKLVGEALVQREQSRLLAIAHHNDKKLAAQGLDAHAGTRDQRAREAMQLLWKHQEGAVSEAQIEQAKNQFIQYLHAFKMPAEHRAKAKKALLEPKGVGEHFGALIEEEPFTLLGLKVSGSDLIGRLWIFASNLPDPKEEQNAKYGMITALRVESYNDHGGRICNQRKTQQQFLAVLQGRLDGVMIDREGLLSGSEAMQIFFQKKEHRQLPNREELYLAAIGFCHASNRVEKQSFMTEIEEYAGVAF